MSLWSTGAIFEMLHFLLQANQARTEVFNFSPRGHSLRRFEDVSIENSKCGHKMVDVQKYRGENSEEGFEI